MSASSPLASSPLAPSNDRRLRIAFLGSSLVSAYWNGAATYYRGLLRALAERGHRIAFFEPDAFQRQQHRDMANPSWASVHVYPATEEGARGAVAQAANADLIVKASGIGVFDAWLEDAVVKLKRPGRLVAFWDVDAPATLDRVETTPSDPFRRLIPHYDVIFTYGGGEPVVQAYRRLGAARCQPIYNALDPEVHGPDRASPRFACDLAFLGNRLPDREARVEEFFLSVARRLPERRFLLGGNGWNAESLPPNVQYVGHVYTTDHNALNASALAVLNVHRDSMARYGYSPATRIFEAGGAGSCIISDACEGLSGFLTPDQEILLARDGAEVAAHLTALHPARAAEIGSRARRRLLDHHTYAHRAAEVDAALALLLAP